MFSLLASHQGKVDESNVSKSITADQDSADTQMNNDTPTPSTNSHHTTTSSRGSFDLAASPLGIVSSLSSSILSNARRHVESAVSVGGDAAKLIHTQVKRGMEKGVEGIERATRNNAIHAVEEKEQNDSDEWESNSSTHRDHHQRRMSWSQRKGTTEEGESKEDAPEETDIPSPNANATSSDSSLSTTDGSILRMNFLRLLNRCEEISFAHLHPSPGVPGVLHTPRDARAFGRSVTLLRDMLAEFRRRRINIQINKENALFVRRVAFLATLAEKVTQHAATQHAQRKLHYHRPHSVHFARPATTLLSAVNSAALAGTSANTIAGSSSIAASASPLTYDDSMESLLDRSSPSTQTDRDQDIRNMLFARQAQRSHERGASSSSSISSTSGQSESKEFSAELEQRRVMSDLHDMTDALKSNAMTIRKALGSDAKVLDAVDTQLDHNLHSITHENSRLAKWASSGCSEMCWNILLIITLWTVFIGMFIFMKIFPAPK